jgi:hypothetical protein
MPIPFHQILLNYHNNCIYFGKETSCRSLQRFVTVRGRRLPPRLNLIIPSAGLLRGVSWFKTDVSELPIDSVLKGHPEEF